MPDSFTIEPDGSRIRKLLTPIRSHGGKQITVIRLRAPKYRDVMSHGDPSAMIIMNGAVLPHEDMGVVERYISALATDETGAVLNPGLLEQLDYIDAIALKDAVMDFFKAASRPAASTPPTP